MLGIAPMMNSCRDRTAEFQAAAARAAKQVRNQHLRTRCVITHFVPRLTDGMRLDSHSVWRKLVGQYVSCSSAPTEDGRWVTRIGSSCS